MRLAKWVSLVATFIIAFFVNVGWFFDACARHVCPDSYGIYPLISYQPNFFIGQRCGGFAGNCIPAHWNFSLLIFDIILMVVLNLILFLIINKVSGKKKSQNV